MKNKVAWSLLTVAAVGCGEVSNPPDSDGGPDGPPDGPPAAQPVKVRVSAVATDGSAGTGQPDSAAIAVFVGPDGNVIKQGQVNQQGEAEAMAPEGSTLQTIQISEPTLTSRRVFVVTFHDVKPGDVLNSGLPRTLPDNRGTSTTMTGSFITNAAYSHTFFTECGSTTSAGPDAALTLQDGCHGPIVDVLGIQTSTAVPPLPARYAISKPAYGAGGTFNLNNTWQNMANFAITVSNLPEDITGLTLRRSTFMRAGAAAAIAPQSVSLGDPPAGAGSGSVLYAPTAGVRAAVFAELSKATGFLHRLEVQTDGISSTQTIDYNELSVPWINTLSYVGAERKLSWTETASGSGVPDVRVAASTFRYTRGEITYNVTMYDIARPAAATSMVFAGLPATYAEFDPAQQTGVTSTIAILSYVDQSNLNGYDDARKYGLSAISGVGSTDQFADQAYRRRFTVASARGNNGLLPGVR